MDERLLYDFKWFDNRPLMPDTATLSFALWHVRKLGDHLTLLDEGGLVVAVKTFMKDFDMNDPRGWKHFKMCEKLRQWADSKFMRYEDFWIFGFQTYNNFGLGMKFWGRKSGVSSRRTCYIPINLFNSPKILADIERQRDELHRQRMIMSSHPFFRAESWVGAPLQWDYAQYIADEFRRRYGRTAFEHAAILVESGRLHPDAHTQKLFGVRK